MCWNACAKPLIISTESRSQLRSARRRLLDLAKSLASMDSRRRGRDSSAHEKSILHACFSFFVIWSWVVAAGAQQTSLETDRLALERFKGRVDPSGKLLPWVSGTNPCTWTGVACYKNRVAWLQLPRWEFTGALPGDALGDLDQLRVLSLHHNRFTGAFPAGLARCTTLQALFLGYNLLSGPLPDFTGLWPRMSHFSVGYNNLSGPIPASIKALSRLLVLDLERNAFSGEMPVVSFENLRNFSVANNELVGPVPVSFQRFNASSFGGNVGLCGPPTRNLCPFTAPPADAPFAFVPAPAGAPLPRPSSWKHEKSKLSVGVVAGIATGGAVTVSLVLIIIVCFLRRRGDDLDKSHARKQVAHCNTETGTPTGADHFKESYAVTFASEPQNRSKRLQFLDQGNRQEFALDELLRASAEVLGKGSMGTSYRADLEGDCVVIVKRLKDVIAERHDFETHVEKLRRLRHRHLMPLRAYYFSHDEKLLVSDFMPRGSLYSLLHGERSDDRVPLDWVSREKIALGSARALAYLHKPCVNLAHGNIKSSNILLNRDYEPFLADYGLTNLLNPGVVCVSRFPGYRAMEVTDIRKICMQSDVYSYGVLMLELVTGKPPTLGASPNNPGIDLPKWVSSVAREDWESQVFDVELKRSNTYVEEMEQMLQLAVACVDGIPERRPKMEEVVLLLEDITQLGTSTDSSVCHNAKSSSPPLSRGSRSCTPTPLYTRPSSGVFMIGD